MCVPLIYIKYFGISHAAATCRGKTTANCDCDDLPTGEAVHADLQL